MQLTIVAPDNVVFVNGRGLKVDCSTLADYVRVVQWNGGSGHVEMFAYDGAFVPSIEIDGIADFQSIVDAWQAVADAADAPPEQPLPPTIAELIGYANYAQWRKATGGCLVSISGESVPFSTSEAAMSLIAGKVSRLQQPNPPASVNWQVGPTTFKSIAAADFISASIEIADFIQSTFDELPAIFAAIAAGTYTTTAEIDAALA
jgi:hypothetical protein